MSCVIATKSLQWMEKSMIGRRTITNRTVLKNYLCKLAISIRSKTPWPFENQNNIWYRDRNLRDIFKRLAKNNYYMKSFIYNSKTELYIKFYSTIMIHES